jgi:hypothetical protein
VWTFKREPYALTVWMVARADATGGFWARTGVTAKANVAARAILNGVIASLPKQC